jgi:cell division septation protein DedD
VKKLLLTACTFVLMVCGSRGWAATAVIDVVQMPAWLEHEGRVGPLLPGQPVVDGDKVRTGQGARVYIRLPEGSTVKLGESVQLAYQSASQENSIFKAALNVLTGAFRFTTAAARKLQKRDVAIRVGNATIGIRGTDVWGRSGKDEDLVMLIEGHVEVRPVEGDVVQLTESMAVFTSPKTGIPNPVSKASWDDFKARARETDIEKGDGAARSGGRVNLSLATLGDEAQALALYDQVRAAGYGAKIRPVMADGESAAYKYEVLIPGFTSRAEASVASASLKRLTGIKAGSAPNTGN